jgi:hypothetical protein
MRLLVVLCAGLLWGCIPEHLQKYRSASATSVAEPVSAVAAPTGGEKRATIYALDKQTFRFLIREDEVWDSAVSVLLRNYNLNIVDRPTGIITTEWDSFYLKQAVYRNKVTVRIRRVAGAVEVTLLNNVERLRDASTAASGVGAVWLPAEDMAGETGRLVQNMALVLNQPPPLLPPGMVAGQASDTGAGTIATPAPLMDKASGTY